MLELIVTNEAINIFQFHHIFSGKNISTQHNMILPSRFNVINYNFSILPYRVGNNKNCHPIRMYNHERNTSFG